MTPRPTDTTADAPLILGVSGLRGIVGRSLTPDVAARFVGSFAGWLKDAYTASLYGEDGGEDADTGDDASHDASELELDIVVGRDGRAGGHAIAALARSVLMAAGCRVHDAGVCTTPTLGLAVDRLAAAAGIMVTASHNPQEWNGLKIILAQADAEGELIASAPPADLAQQIVDRFKSDDARSPWVSGVLAGTEHADKHPEIPHVATVAFAIADLTYTGDDEESGDAPDPGTGLRCVVDSVNASGAKLAEEGLLSLGAELVQLHGIDHGLFPHTPEPTRDNLSGDGGLCDAVPGLKADIGFAQDPDADRLAIIDEKGSYIGEEYTLAICAESLLTAPGLIADGDDGRGSGPPVLVANLSTSRMIDDVAAKHGAEVVRTPVGEANVVERIKQLKDEGRCVVLGGEGNGGVIWPDVVYIRDSLSAMALTLSLMSRTGETVSSLVERINSFSTGGAGYAIVKRKANIPSKDAAQPAVDAVAEAYADEAVDLQDGVRVDFTETGPRGGASGNGWAGSWVHVRASNTEPIMRLICEAPTEAIANEILAEVKGVIGG